MEQINIWPSAFAEVLRMRKVALLYGQQDETEQFSSLK